MILITDTKNAIEIDTNKIAFVKNEILLFSISSGSLK